MGPLSGFKVVELAGIGPGPMCAVLLADLGATVLRVDRLVPSELGLQRPLQYHLLMRNRPSIRLDLKNPEAVELVLKLTEKADALIEGFRPGVTERLGLGPTHCLQRNPKLVYGRMTGWGQEGPLSQYAGHDINYIALTGALHAIGPNGGPPTVPLNLVGDFGGGSLYLAFGMMCAWYEAQRSGKGQVVDSAIVDGVASLMTMFHGLAAAGMMTNERGSNNVDGGAPFYGVYECSDGKFLAVGPVEEKFYDELVRLLEIDPNTLPDRSDRTKWRELRDRLQAVIRTRSRDEWAARLEKTDACVSPVLTVDEASRHPHMQTRKTYIDLDGVVQPAPAPRFSRSIPAAPTPPREPGETPLKDVLTDWFSAAEIATLSKSGVFDRLDPGRK